MTVRESNGSGATCKDHEGHEARITSNERRLDHHSDLLVALQKRVPAWASVLMTFMGVLLGGAFGLVAAGIWGG